MRKHPANMQTTHKRIKPDAYTTIKKCKKEIAP